MKVYQKLPSLLTAVKNCIDAGNNVWEEKHQKAIDSIMESAPSGSGLNSGTTILEDECSPRKLVFKADFHHIDEFGYYDGWTEHKIVVTPSFQGFDVRITGRDKNMIKDYLADIYYQWLGSEV